MYQLKKSYRSLSDRDVYPCPICHTGEIATLPLMEAMACRFCNHIYIADLEKQQLEMADRHPPLVWRWNGNKWTQGQLKDVKMGWGYSLGAIALVFLPTFLIGITVYVRPPISGSLLSWVPVFWTGLTFLLHLGIIVWLIVEFYEFPLWTYLSRKCQILIR